MRIVLLAMAIATLATAGELMAQTTAPFGISESLDYEVKWPSGLSIGEANFHAELGGERWDFALHIKAGIPGLSFETEIRSAATSDFCSLELSKQMSYGRRKVNEKTTFDQSAGTATRASLEGGGESVIETESCPADALTFVYILRRDLARGQIPQPRTVLFGSAYEIRFELVGETSGILRGESVRADRLMGTVEGPASTSSFVVEVARDDARTPLKFTVPTEEGTFSLELVQE